MTEILCSLPGGQFPTSQNWASPPGMCLLVPALGFPAFRASQSAQLTSSLRLRTHLMWGSAWERQEWKYVFSFQNSSLVIHLQAARCSQCPAVPSPAVTPVALSLALHCLLAGGGGGREKSCLAPRNCAPNLRLPMEAMECSFAGLSDQPATQKSTRREAVCT